MPRGRKPKIKEQDIPIGNDISLRLANLEKANAATCNRLDEIENRLLKLEIPVIKKEIDVEEIKRAGIPITTSSTHPIPPEYLDLITTILNSKFMANIEYLGDRPEFMFTIIVPDEYTSIHPDLRSKVIANSAGMNGVREWVNLVYSSFNPETKARIKATI